MTPTYRYLHASKTLSQVASMAEPNHLDYKINKNGEWLWKTSDSVYRYGEDYDEYHKHLASLKQYPTTGFSETDDQKEFGEGEFELRYECQHLDNIGLSWAKCSKEHFDKASDNVKRIIAVRISKQEEKEDGVREEKVFTEEDLDNCWSYYKSYLIDILNGEYDLDTAREDLRGLIGGEFDKRTKN